MKVFDSANTWGGHKVNFADSNNVVVGYDMDQQCCENADWFISVDKLDEMKARKDLPEIPLDDYNFNPDYFDEVPRFDGDEGGMVRFEMIRQAPVLQRAYLHLYNSHNGYYSHGFTVQHGDKMVKEGSL